MEGTNMRTLREMVTAIEPHLSAADKDTISRTEWEAACSIITPDVQTRWVAQAWKNLYNLGAFIPIRGSKTRCTIDYHILDEIILGNGYNPFKVKERVDKKLNDEEAEVLRKHLGATQ
jgi:hypothetical protein